MIPLKDENPSSTFPVVTVALMAVNAAVFVYQAVLGAPAYEAFIYRTAVIPYEVTRFADLAPADLVPPPFTLLTAMFVHGGLLHVGSNLLYLWIFGDNVEDRLGHLPFLLFYLGAGLIASIAHVAAAPDSAVPMIGASGAIAGVLGAYVVLYPRARIKTFVFFVFYMSVVRVPAIFFLGFWFAMQLLSSVGSGGAGGGIAWYAHIGGFAAGVAAMLVLRPRARPPVRPPAA